MSASYNPLVAPDQEEWLLLDESERIEMVKAFHKKHRIRLPNPQLHAGMHTVIENQLAEGEDAVVRAMDRLMAQGLDRHDAIHALSWVFTMQLVEKMKSPSKSPEISLNDSYLAAVERVSAQDWLNSQSA